MRPNVKIGQGIREVHRTSFAKSEEPESTKAATKRTVEILDASYDKADLPKVIEDTCKHLSREEQSKLLQLLESYAELFDGTLGDFQTEPVSLELKPGFKPYHGKPYPIPKKHDKAFRKEVERLVKIGVLRRQDESEWGSPAFIIPKKDQTIRFLTDFRKVNEKLFVNHFQFR